MLRNSSLQGRGLANLKIKELACRLESPGGAGIRVQVHTGSALFFVVSQSCTQTFQLTRKDSLTCKGIVISASTDFNILLKVLFVTFVSCGTEFQRFIFDKYMVCPKVTLPVLTE